MAAVLPRTEAEEQLRLRKDLLTSGESYNTTTLFGGRRWLRFTFMSPATTLEDVSHTLELLQEAAGRLEGQPPP